MSENNKKRKHVEVVQYKDTIEFKHECGENMQIRLRKTDGPMKGYYKQWMEIKCWNCKTTMKPWKKNLFKKQFIHEQEENSFENIEWLNAPLKK